VLARARQRQRREARGEAIKGADSGACTRSSPRARSI
jgi:hypothetical protein